MPSATSCCPHGSTLWAPGPYDHLRRVTVPFELDVGGYAVVAPAGEPRQVFGDLVAAVLVAGHEDRSRVTDRTTPPRRSVVRARRAPGPCPRLRMTVGRRVLLGGVGPTCRGGILDRAQLESLFDLTGAWPSSPGARRGIGRCDRRGVRRGGREGRGREPQGRRVRRDRGAPASRWAARRSASRRTSASSTSSRRSSRRRSTEFGRLDIVVNNAATALTMPLGTLTPEAWAKSYDVNLRGPVFLVQEALPHLRESPCAAVVNVISAGAFLFSAPVAMYAGREVGADVVHPLDGRRRSRPTASA